MVRRPRAAPWFALPLMAVLGAAGCESVMWYGFDPARTTSIRAIAGCGEQFLVVNGEEFPSHDAIALETLAISESGRVAYAARDGNEWWLHVGRDSAFRARAELRHVAWSGDRDVVVVDADDRTANLKVVRVEGDHRYTWRGGPAFDSIAKDGILAVGDFIAYVGRRGDSTHVVVNDLIGPDFDGVASLHLDPRGRPSYIARRGEQAWVVRHGELDGPFDNAAELVSDARGERIVALVRSEEGWRADDGSWASEAFDYIGDLRFSRTGQLAFRAGREDGDLIVVEERVLGPYPEVKPGSLAFRGNDEVVFAVKSSEGVRLLGDRMASEAWSEITEIATDPLGRVGFIGRRADSTFVVVIDGVERGGWSYAGDLVLGQRGSEAFVVRRLGRDLIIANGIEYPFEEVIGGTLRFASDGATWGALTVVDGKLVLSMAGGRAAAIDLEEVTGEVLRRRAAKEAGMIVDRWISNTLERAIAPRTSRAR